jgi:RNA polymerase sigma factor (sigma-70 family)
MSFTIQEAPIADYKDLTALFNEAEKSPQQSDFTNYNLDDYGSSFTIHEAPKSDYHEPTVVLSEIEEEKKYLGFIESPPEHDDDYELIPDLSDGVHHIQDFFTSTAQENPEFISVNTDLRENLLAVLKLTSDKEREIIMNLYSLNNTQLSYEELAKLFNMKESKVKELETKALKKLKKSFIEYKLA